MADGLILTVLSVCKQTRSEALLIYYLENTFEIKLAEVDPAPLVKWRRKKERFLVPTVDSICQ